MLATTRLVALAALLAAGLSGCAAWNDRYSTAYDPVMSFLGARPQGIADWPAARLPDLPAMSTYDDLMPNRQPAPGVPGLGWPPLSAPVEPSGLEGGAPTACASGCAPATSRAPTSDPARPAGGGEPLPPR